MGFDKEYRSGLPILKYVCVLPAWDGIQWKQKVMPRECMSGLLDGADNNFLQTLFKHAPFENSGIIELKLEGTIWLLQTPVTKLDWQLIEKSFNESAELERQNGVEDHMFHCQENIVNATVNHPLNLKYPLPDVYIRSFLKTLIDKVEKYSCEIHHQVLEKYTSLICKNLSNVESGHRTFIIDDSTSLSLKENISIISDGTTGLHTWQAAFYLAEWCIANRERFNGMSVIELGSGTGLVGLACYKICQPRFITLTDFHPKVMETLSYNLETNKLITPQSDSSIHMQPLDWMEYSKNGNELQADMVLASDVVYDVDLIPFLVKTLAKLLQPNTQKLPSAVIACTERNEETLDRFLSELVFHNLKYEHLEHAPAVFACERNYPVRIYEIQPIQN